MQIHNLRFCQPRIAFHVMTVAAVIALSACSSSDQGVTQANAPSATADLGRKNPHAYNGNRHQSLEVAQGKVLPAPKAPVQLVANDQLNGTIQITQAGEIHSFDVLIGNYMNSSDGNLSVKVCAGSICSEGETHLTSSTDDKFLPINLTPHLALQIGQSLTYQIRKEGGSKPVAIWLGPSGGMFQPLSKNNKLIDGAPHIMLGYE